MFLDKKLPTAISLKLANRSGLLTGIFNSNIHFDPQNTQTQKGLNRRSIIISLGLLKITI